MSANNFGFEVKPSDKSFIYIRKNNDPRIDPWEILVSTLVNRLPDIAFSTNFKRRPSCQTLSNAFDISRKMPLLSRPSSSD